MGMVETELLLIIYIHCQQLFIEQCRKGDLLCHDDSLLQIIVIDGNFYKALKASSFIEACKPADDQLIKG